MNREPAITVGAVSALIAAGIALLVAFGVPLNDAQQTAILGLVAAAAPIVSAVLIRARVTPTSQAEHRADAGYSVIELAVGVLVLVILVVVLFRLL